MQDSASDTEAPGSSTGLRQFREGSLAILPATVAAIPFAILLGGLAADKGLSAFQAGAMSALVFAGSSQFVALASWTMPPLIGAIALATLVVNMRHMFMSASLLRHIRHFPKAARLAALALMADEIWAYAEARVASGQRLTIAYYAGLSVLFYLSWIIWTAVGAVIGHAIADPVAFGFDFAFIAIFIGLIMGFRARSGFVVTIAASAAAALATHLVVAGPWSIVAGALAGVGAAYATGGREARP